jgi:signal transduction histidine kinase
MIPGCVSQERLTRQELSWLLAQEARGAAKALREGVQQLAHPLPAEVSISEVSDAPAVETNLDALDDAISRLSELQMGQTSKARRGRIDLASLLCEVVPNARIAMETGSGTEVFGEESELRRMLHLLVSRTNSSPADAEPTRTDIEIRREGDWVRISVELGPDSSATAELERRFLSRMATRHGGRLELEGGMETLILPADRATDEVAELRKELEQAQQLGEAYARELAAVFATAEGGSDPKASTLPPPPGSEQLALLVTTSHALVRQLRTWLEGARADISNAVDELGPENEVATQLTWRISSFQELFAELERLANHAMDEAPARVDLAAELKELLQSAEPRAARHGVSLELDAPETLEVSTLLDTFVLAARGLLDQAIAATPRDGHVRVRLSGNASAFALAIEDGGPVVANASRRDLLRGRADPSSLGRPEGLGLAVADAAASVLGGAISIGESSTGRSEVLLSV